MRRVIGLGAMQGGIGQEVDAEAHLTDSALDLRGIVAATAGDDTDRYCFVALMAWKAPPWVMVLLAAVGGAAL
ncbi:hypothetical protein DPM13_17785 [Paracoccus mutanolyticus]|uniref:Cobalamin biosynthesis protein n=1 Tax=Paracoccus mutanolyticus TaxID=1499308 RepID=A0ABM6WTZ3_9RHOB|nr:hypothetical protein DPM13_17785 [Paracoccus mutanolyticus]